MSSTTLGANGDGEQEAVVRRHLAQMWGVSTSSWSLVDAVVVEQALPVMAPGAPMFQPIQLEERMFLAGDHRDTPSQQGALVSGRRAAESALRALG